MSTVGTLQSQAWQELVESSVLASWTPDTSLRTQATACSGCFWSSSTKATSLKVCSMVVLPPPLPPSRRDGQTVSTHPPQEEPWPQDTEGSMRRLQDDETPVPPQGMHLWSLLQGGPGGHVPGTHLQDPATDVPVTGLALDAELGMVVRLTVRDAIPLGEGGEGGERQVSWAGDPLAAAPALGGHSPAMAGTAKPAASTAALTC